MRTLTLLSLTPPLLSADNLSSPLPNEERNSSTHDISDTESVGTVGVGNSIVLPNYSNNLHVGSIYRSQQLPT